MKVKAQRAEGPEGQVSICEGISIKHMYVNTIAGNN